MWLLHLFHRGQDLQGTAMQIHIPVNPVVTEEDKSEGWHSSLS